jgi:hypothetical protein
MKIKHKPKLGSNVKPLQNTLLLSFCVVVACHVEAIRSLAPPSKFPKIKAFCNGFKEKGCY